jgi:hypothetical protein
MTALPVVHKALYEDEWSLVKNIVSPYDSEVADEPYTRTQWYYRVSGPTLPNERQLVMQQISASLEPSLIVVATARIQRMAEGVLVPTQMTIRNLLNDYPVSALYQMPPQALLTLDSTQLKLTESLYHPLSSVNATIRYLMLNGRDGEVDAHLEAWERQGTTNVLWRMLSKTIEWNAVVHDKLDRDSFVMQSVPIMTDKVLTARYDSPLLAKLRDEADKRKPIEP